VSPASEARPPRAHDDDTAGGTDHPTGEIHPEPRSHIDHGHERLVRKPVEQRSWRVAVHAAEDDVAFGERAGVIPALEIPLHGADGDRHLGLPDVPARDLGLVQVADVGALHAEDPRHVRSLDAIAIHGDDLADAEVRELGANHRAGPAKADDADPPSTQRALSISTECEHLSCEAEVAVLLAAGRGSRRDRASDGAHLGIDQRAVDQHPRDHRARPRHHERAVRHAWHEPGEAGQQAPVTKVVGVREPGVERHRVRVHREITELPYAAPAWPGRPNVRRRVVAKFPYAIVYVVEPAAIRILAIEHAKRRPGRWLHQL
jgi:hypothetical protein